MRHHHDRHGGAEAASILLNELYPATYYAFQTHVASPPLYSPERGAHRQLVLPGQLILALEDLRRRLRDRGAHSQSASPLARDSGKGSHPCAKLGLSLQGEPPSAHNWQHVDAALGCLRNGPADKRASTQLPSTRPTVTSARTSCLPGGSPGSRTRCPMRADRCRWGTSGPAGTSRMGSPRSKCKSSAVAMAHVPDGQSAGWGQPALCEGHHGGRTQTSRNVLSKCSQSVCTQAIARSNGR